MAPPPIRLGRNAGLNLLGQALPVAVALLVIPVIVRGLGPAHFGLLALAWTVVSYVGVLDLGFGRAATKRVSEAAWQGAGDRVRRLATTVAAVQVALGMVTGGLVWLAAAPLTALLVADATLRLEGTAMLGILGLAVPAVLVSNGYRAVLEGLHRFDLVNLARAPLSAAIFLVSAAGVVVGASLPTIVLLLAVTRYAGAAVYVLLYYRAAPAGRGGFDPGAVRDLIGFGGWVAVSNAVVPIGIYLERFVLSGLKGPTALAFYTAPQELVLKLHMLPAAISAVLFPALSGLASVGEQAELVRQVRRGIRVVALLLAVPAAVLIVAAEPLLTIWLGADYGAQSTSVLRVLAFAVFLNGLAHVPFVLAEGIGRPDLIAKYHIAELPLYASATWVLTDRFGIMGTASAWAMRMVIMAPVLYLLVAGPAKIRLLDPLRGMPGMALGCSLLLLLAVGLLPWAAGGGAGPTLLGLLLVAAFAAFSWARLLEEQERQALAALPGWLLKRGRGAFAPEDRSGT
jgi:O-antigen/teichoic acid export membrane protein